MLYFTTDGLEVRGPNSTRAKERHDSVDGGGSIDTGSDSDSDKSSNSTRAKEQHDSVDGDHDNVNRVDTVDRGVDTEETKSSCCTVM